MTDEWIFADDHEECAIASYQLTTHDADHARSLAIKVACGQTVGFVPETEELRQLCGRITSLQKNENGHRIDIKFPTTLFRSQTFGVDLSGLLTITFGKVSFAPGISLIQLKSSALEMGDRGPKLGMTGIRQWTQVEHRPLLMAILKPGITPDLDQMATQFAALESGGVDIIKDDEVCIDSQDKALGARIDAIKQASRGHCKYVVNISGVGSEIIDRAHQAQEWGADALLFSPFTFGLSQLQALCHSPNLRLPIFIHPAFCGTVTKVHPAVLLGDLPRLAGADAVLFPSPYGSISMGRQEVQQLTNSLRDTRSPLAPVPSAGITQEHIPEILADFGHDVIINAGTGMGPNPEDGARRFVGAIEEQMAGGTDER